MKKLLFLNLIGLFVTTTSCNKNNNQYGTYMTTEKRTYDGAMMASNVDLSDQAYFIRVEAEDEHNVTLEDIYEKETIVSAEFDDGILTIRKQSMDGFLEIEGTGYMNESEIHLDYKVITPDGNVLCILEAQK